MEARTTLSKVLQKAESQGERLEPEKLPEGHYLASERNDICVDEGKPQCHYGDSTKVTRNSMSSA